MPYAYARDTNYVQYKCAYTINRMCILRCACIQSYYRWTPKRALSSHSARLLREETVTSQWFALRPSEMYLSMQKPLLLFAIPENFHSHPGPASYIVYCIRTKRGKLFQFRIHHVLRAIFTHISVRNFTCTRSYLTNMYVYDI